MMCENVISSVERGVYKELLAQETRLSAYLLLLRGLGDLVPHPTF